MKKRTVIAAGESVEVSFDLTAAGMKAVIGDRVYSLEALMVKTAGNCMSLWMNWNGQSIEVAVRQSGETYSVSIGEHQMDVEISDGRGKRLRMDRSGESGISEIRAPMPGKIVRILVHEGGDVERNHGIVVMEAMKMQNEIKSPASGRIQKLAVVEGETVRSGDLIAVVSA